MGNWSTASSVCCFYERGNTSDLPAVSVRAGVCTTQEHVCEGSKDRLSLSTRSCSCFDQTHLVVASIVREGW